MGQHIHEVLHVAAATLFIVAGVSALLEYRNLRERVVLTYAATCLCSGAYACHVVISHNLPKVGEFWIPWTLAVLIVTFGATFFYLVTMQSFVGVRGRWFLAPLVVQLGISALVTADLLMYAATRRSFLFVPIVRPDVGEHQRALGEGAYSLLPMAEVVAALFMLSFVLGIGSLLVHLLRERSRDVLVYTGLIVTSGIIVNETLVALSVYSGVYLMAFSKAFETVRIHRDIHARSRERIEKRLRQAEKMEAIGRVAGGIAHDFNNVLTAVGGSIELASQSVAPDHGALEDLKTAQEGLETGRRLVHQLLDVARSKETEREYVDVGEFLSDSQKFLSSMIPNSTKLEFRIEPNVGGVMMAPGRLTQVLMNLVINARDAMPEGGRIQIHASTAPRALRRLPELGDRPLVVLTVSDEGRGIPADVLEHVFEPFFTTKSKSGGSGLGLATLYTIVHEAGGHVEVESEVGKGTRFLVLLPRAQS